MPAEETLTAEEEIQAAGKATRRRTRTGRNPMIAEESVKAGEPIQAEEPVQAERILAFIQRHAEGVSSVDIGNELGVDWRSLTTALHSLEEERKIERINTIYYPRERVGEEEL